MRLAVISGLWCLCSLSALAQVPANTSWVRVVHASADAPAVDVLANGSLVFQGLKFKSFTEYTPIPPERIHLPSTSAAQAPLRSRSVL
jgi:hypothetical protein